MSVLNELIKIKESAQKDDLLKMLDEISVYEKLSTDENLKDLKKSKITRSKCPLLAGLTDGNIYETILGELVANVYLQIEDYVPDVLMTGMEQNKKKQKQKEILQKSITRISYQSLTEYDHDQMRDMVAAVFTKRCQDITIAVIIVRDPENYYTMYHGTYQLEKSKKFSAVVSTPDIVKGEYGTFIMKNYSILGNNGYRFGSYSNNGIMYDVMISPEGKLYLMDGNKVAVEYLIPKEEQNDLNTAKKSSKEFAKQLVSIIESVVQL